MTRVALVLLLAGHAVAQEKADTPEQAAERVLAALRAKGDLRELAAKDDPDPWLVADELCARGEHDAAEAFARAAPRPDTEKLPAYVAARRTSPADPGLRESLRAADAAGVAGRGSEALALIDAARLGDDVISARLRFARGLALRMLRRWKESADAFLAAADAAGRLGWLAREAKGLEHAGMSADSGSLWPEALSAYTRQSRVEEARGNRAGVGRSLGSIGLIHSWLGDYPKALECHERSLKLMEQLGDRAGIARAVGNLGLVYGYCGDYARALECAERTLKLMEELGDRRGIALAEGNLGLVHRQKGNNAVALVHQQRALKLMEELGDARGVAGTLGNLATTYWYLGDFPKALACAERTLRLMEELKDPAGIARAHGSLGSILQELGNYPRALEHQERSLRLSEQLGDRAGAADTIGNIGIIHHILGDYRKAIECQERALAIMEEVGDLQGVAGTLGNIGVAHERLGDYRTALEYQERSLKLTQDLGDRSGVANMLANIGNVYFALGDYVRALEYQERSLRLEEEMGNRSGVSRSLGNIGAIHERRGDYAKALGAHERAFLHAQASGDRAAAASALGSIGVVRDVLGDHATALDYLERALKLREDLGAKPGIARALGDIGNVHRSLGDFPRALDCLERSLRLWQEIEERSGAAGALSNLGLTLVSSEEFTKALERYGEALALMEELGDRPGVARVLANMGLAHARLKDYRAALAHEERALAEAEAIGERETVVRALWGLSQAAGSLGEHEEALAYCNRAVEALGQLASGLADEQGARAREQFVGVFENGVTAAALLDDTRAACHHLESGRAAMLLEALGGRDALRMTAIPEDLRIEEASARARESAAVDRLRAAAGRGGPAEEEAKRALAAAQREVAAAIDRIQRRAKTGAGLLYPKADSLDTIRARLAPSEALVLYGLLTHGAIALVVTPGGGRIVDLGEAAPIVEACARFAGGGRTTRGMTGFAGTGTKAREAPRILRERIWKPLGLDDTVRRVLVSPDGALAGVPFCLLDGTREILYVPSGTAYGLLLEEKGKRGERVLALGDPDYAAEPTDELGFLRPGGALARLPGTREEAKAIADLVLLGPASTKEGLLDAIGKEPRWRAVHLACHGLLNAERPMLSSLALSNGGFLTALDVYRARIPADLVVLSACETARGRAYRAEGTVGFVSAFMFAGAPRVIVSLWDVDDDATRALMVKFYELWKAGSPCVAALKEAQEQVASRDAWRDPRFWAAWQLWGLGD